jgi:hypothetical protein
MRKINMLPHPMNSGAGVRRFAAEFFATGA